MITYLGPSSMTLTSLRAGTRICAALAAIILVATACSTTSDAPKVPLGQRTPVESATTVAVGAHAIIGPRAKAALDTGNSLYRKKQYDAALTYYRAASALAPQHAAPFFGMYMVARATSNSVLADSALAAIRVRNGPLPPAPGSLHDSVLGRMHELAKKRAST